MAVVVIIVIVIVVVIIVIVIIVIAIVIVILVIVIVIIVVVTMTCCYPLIYCKTMAVYGPGVFALMLLQQQPLINVCSLKQWLLL